MSKGFKISEQTPDRQYFTLVPNYIVNHSDIWEQGVYLAMKRIAGENGTCFATHQRIADMLKISRPTVSKTIQRLIKRDWVKETGKRVGRTQSVKEYKIVDLWKLNVDYYQKVSSKPQNSLSKRKLSTTEQLSCKPQNTEEDSRIKKNNTKKSITVRKKKYSSIKDISNGEFEEIAQKYDVPMAFVRSKYDDLVNYCQARGRVYKNYKFALMKFVKKDAMEIKDRYSDRNRKAGIDATKL
jgi:DNA-binding Lrp family transcriptional regulator